VVAATFVSTATIFGVTYSFTTFLKAMADEFGTGKGSTALMFGLTIFFLFVLGLPAGRASDRWGPRPVVVFGGATMTVGLLLTSVVNHIAIGYLTYGLGVGIGTACCYVPMVSQVSGWFDKKRATALGIAVSGIGVGTLTGPLVADWLIDEHGWRSTYRIFSVASAVGLGVAAVLALRAPVSTGRAPLDLRLVSKSPMFRAIYAAGLLMTLALFVPFVFLKPYAEDHGIASGPAAALVSFLGIGSLAGRLVLGAVAGRLGVLRLYEFCFVVLGGSFLIWLVGGGVYAVLALFAVVLGISYGGYVALSPAAAAELFGLTGLGTVLGALYTAGGIGGLIGPPVAGALIDLTGGYSLAIVVAMGLGLSAVVVLHRALRAHASEPVTEPAPAAR
jgi:MFS family permease